MIQLSTLVTRAYHLLPLDDNEHGPLVYVRRATYHFRLFCIQILGYFVSIMVDLLWVLQISACGNRAIVVALYEKTIKEHYLVSINEIIC